ncbi:MAG: 2-C-methyl-D-erythritol 4-phosphate cytidylyltransferase [Candidatus Omnitrophota bacterium]|nr:2-C-methyl-D-erythritol 4-phosphate cytidylyltransferase [Candidatus Omnitrophota bacterium]
MKVTAIVPSAGLGERLNKKIAKPLVLLNRKPIVIHTLENLSKSKLINEIILVVSRNYIDAFRKNIKHFGLKKVKNIILGGVTRSQSVANGLKAISEDTDFVLIHDAVRPFISQKSISEVVKSAKKFGAAILAVPAKATIKKVDLNKSEVVETLNRDVLCEVMTPQVFRKDLILSGYNRLRKFSFTDDAVLLERLGYRVKVVMGSYTNIKITTPEDLIVAEGIVKNFKT